MIHQKYTMFTRIPLFVDEEGRILADELWQKDLELHLDYIENFYICCPLVNYPADAERCLPLPRLTLDKVISLRADKGLGSVVKNFIPNFLKVRSAVRQTQIAHSGGAGWAFPLSFYILPLKYIYDFKWIVVIESSFWMKPKNRRGTLRELITHHLHRILLGKALKKAEAPIFTSKSYRDFFHLDSNKGYVAPAIWIDESSIISPEENNARIQNLPKNEIRLLFPARLVSDKGVEVLLSAIKILSEDNSYKHNIGYKIKIDIIGDGALRKLCQDFCSNYQGPLNVNLLESVSYGPKFFSILQKYHAMVLANLQDEQPRILFDAFSQGLPAISSSTAGVRSIATDGFNSLLYATGSAQDLAQTILRFASDPQLQHSLSKASLQSAAGNTHTSMHQKREEYIKTIL